MKKTVVAMTILLIALLVIVTWTGFAGQGQEREVGLVCAVRNGLVIQIVFVKGIQALDLQLVNKTDGSLKVVILPGTIFYPAEDKTQALVVTQQVIVYLAPGEDKTAAVNIACYNMRYEQPTDATAFRPELGKTDSTLFAKLVQSEMFQDATFRIQQFAIWLITDHPQTRQEFAGLGLGSDVVDALQLLGVPPEALVYFYIFPESTYDLTEDEFFGMRLIFTLAGIPIEDRDDLYDLFAEGLATKGELRAVCTLFEEAEISVKGFPALSSIAGGGSV